MQPSSQRTPVYVTHQNLEEHGGGATSVTAWVLEALWRRFDVRLATPGPAADFQRIDKLYGTCLRHAAVGTYRLHEPSWLRAFPPHKLKSLRLGIALADPLLRQNGEGLVFNTANEMSFGRKSVTYVHCPIRHRRMVAEMANGGERQLRAANNLVFKLVSGFDQVRFLRSACVANSQWTASALYRTYGIIAPVIYPPVVLPARPGKPLQERSPGFVCISRICAEKRIHEAIELVDEMRSRRHEVHLHIVGTGSGRYARHIEQQAAARPFVFIHYGLSRHELASLLDDHQFGLHMMRNEHFGMAVAEMAAAGMIVIAHRSAGPIEILGHDWPLLFEDARGVADICESLISDRSLQNDLHEWLRHRNIREKFSPEVFTRSIQRVTEDALWQGD